MTESIIYGGFVLAFWTPDETKEKITRKARRHGTMYARAVPSGEHNLGVSSREHWGPTWCLIGTRHEIESRNLSYREIPERGIDEGPYFP